MSAASESPTVVQPENAARQGFTYALLAYGLWGFLPFFLKAVGHIPPAEVVAHRILWSIPVAGAALLLAGRSADLKAALGSLRMIGMGALTATFLTLNWGLYVWAVGSGHTLEGALGYYINPLFSVFLAAVLLGERLSRPQMAAILLAVLAVALLSWETGGLPWISLGLAGSWGIYALLKKALPIGPNQGFFLEILLLSPFALIYLLWLGWNGGGQFGPQGSWRDVALLVAAGPITAVPLIFYANGAKRLRLSTIAIMQYIAPSIVFLIAVFIFREPLGATRAIAFALIWTGLAIYTWSMLRGRRRNAPEGA